MLLNDYSKYTLLDLNALSTHLFFNIVKEDTVRLSLKHKKEGIVAYYLPPDLLVEPDLGLSSEGGLGINIGVCERARVSTTAGGFTRRLRLSRPGSTASTRSLH